MFLYNFIPCVDNVDTTPASNNDCQSLRRSILAHTHYNGTCHVSQPYPDCSAQTHTHTLSHESMFSSILMFSSSPSRTLSSYPLCRLKICLRAMPLISKYVHVWAFKSRHPIWVTQTIVLLLLFIYTYTYDSCYWVVLTILAHYHYCSPCETGLVTMFMHIHIRTTYPERQEQVGTLLMTSHLVFDPHGVGWHSSAKIYTNNETQNKREYN